MVVPSSLECHAVAKGGIVKAHRGNAMLGAGSKRLTNPPQMQISIDNHAQPLKMLLFIRYAWSLTEELNLPELSPAPEVGTSALPDTENRQVWDYRWSQEWSRAWDWYDSRESQRAPISQEEMVRISHPGQPLHPVVPPFWMTEYGPDGIDRDAFMNWDRLTTLMGPNPYPKLPLLDAWQKGIRNITVLPYSGYLAERRNASHLVVSENTMKDHAQFLLALG